MNEYDGQSNLYYNNNQQFDDRESLYEDDKINERGKFIYETTYHTHLPSPSSLY